MSAVYGLYRRLADHGRFTRLVLDNARRAGGTPSYAPLFLNPSGPPTNGSEGAIYFDDDDHALYAHNGTSFQHVAATANGRTKLSLFADFSAYPDGSPAGTTPEFAPNPWVTTGAQLPVVSGGKLSSSGSGYLATTIDPGVFLMGGDVSFGGSGTSATVTLALSRVVGADGSTLLLHFAHLIIGPTGCTLTIRKDGGDFEFVSGFPWATPCALDGTVYQFGLMRRGNVLTVIGPAGELVPVNDFRVAAVFDGNTGGAFWQAASGGTTKGYLHKAWAFSQVASRYPNLDTLLAGSGLPPYAATIDGSQQSGLVAGFGRAGQVFIGDLPPGPAIQFGSKQKTTLGYLTAPINIGDTTFSADRVILGTVQIGIGNDEETFNAVGYPSGTGPFVHTITAATKAHAAGEGVNGTSTAGALIYMSLGNGLVYLPSNTAFSGATYVGSDLTTRIDGASNQLSMASGDSFKVDGTWNGGHLVLGTYHLWQDGTGKLYIKNGAPTSATDGTVVGAQS